MLTSANCKDTILCELAKLPSPLKEEIATAICATFDENEKETCPGCETVKITSPLYISEEDGVCVSFRDEHGVYVTRCFGINDILQYLTDDIDPTPIATPEQWESWDYIDRIQAIIFYRCNCLPQ